MSDLHVKYLLVGGGVAAYSACAAIRQRDPHGAIMLAGQEINRPYYRTNLSKSFLRRQSGRSALFTAEPDWFAAHNVQLRTGCRALNLDAGRGIVTLDSGQAISYDKLLLATGCAPRALSIPGGTMANIFTPRTIDDFEQLHTAIDKARSEGHRHEGGKGRGLAAVIGGGLLGVEIAASLTQAGLSVDLIVAGRHPWMKFASEATGQFLAHYLIKHGIKLHESVRAARIEGDGRAQRVVLSDGRTLLSDLVISAIGTIPSKDLLRGTGIIAEKAILADEFCRTNEPNIYAAGDCAAVRDGIFGKHRPPEQWDTAAVTGSVAGNNMAGAEVKMSAVTSFVTEAFGLSARAWGQNKHLDHRLFRGTPNVESPDFLEIGLTAEGRVSQILAVGRAGAGEESVIEELIRRRTNVAGKEEMLKDPATPLANLIE
jgi:3-phenylpropionate/trans-cinnamate dioxygenase ferredoxin reductase component